MDCKFAGKSIKSRMISETKSPASIVFGTTPGGKKVHLYTLRNAHGMEAAIMTYGGIVQSIKVPDRNGKFDDVVLGFDNFDGYLKGHPYFGALVGRYGNRIAHGKFSLDGHTYTLAKNNGPNALHGGLVGFDKVVWDAKSGVGKDGEFLELHYVSKDGEEGYPGNLEVKAVYTLTGDNSLKLEYTAKTDKTTVVNLTQHSYYNLAGKGDVLGHLMHINASKMTPVDDGLIPTGELRDIAGTSFDFQKPETIGRRIGDNDEQLKLGRGYDHNYVLTKAQPGLSMAARVTEPGSGRILEVWTTEPAVQFYSGNFLDGTLKGKNGTAYQARSGFCLEPQHYPDSPNHPDFPSTTLKPGAVYHNIITCKFLAK